MASNRKGGKKKGPSKRRPEQAAQETAPLNEVPAPEPTQQQTVVSASASVADEAMGESSERFKNAMSRVPLILRIVLFALACVFAVVGVKGFIDATGTQSTSRLVTTESVQGEPTRHALVLFSYDDSDSNVSYERSGVLDVLGRSGVSSDVFYLDARASMANPEIEKDLSDLVLAKATSAGGYDAIVAAGNEALVYVTDHQDLFGSIPAAFFAVDDVALASKAQEDGIATGFVEEGAARLSLETGAELMASAGKAVVLIDGSAEAAGSLAQLDGAAGAAAGVQRDVWDASTMTREELSQRLGSLEPNSFVLLLAANHDSLGNTYTPTDTAYFLDRATAAPVYSAIGGVGEGICGASFIDRETQGNSAAKLAIDLINGATVSSRPVQVVAPECSVFDVQALERHGVNANDTPANSTLINEPAFSWRVVRPLVVPVLFLLAAVACIAGFGIIGFRRSIRSNQALIQSRNDLHYRLYHDLLTELPNRHALEEFLANPETGKKVKAVAHIDLNAFTAINDSYGHASGNDVLKVMAKRLSGVSSLLLVRSGGDEFVLAFDRVLKQDSSELRHLARIFGDPVIIGDTSIGVSSRVGIVNRDPGMSAEDLIVFADLAIQHAKETNAQQPVFYNSVLHDNMERKIQITEYLKHAIAEENIVVLWQPQVNTETLTVYGYEALCRLEGNKYYPVDFIPVAEMSGLVNPLDRVVTKKVIEQLGAWRRQGRNPGVASINFSAAQLRDRGYCDFLAELLAVNDVPANLIKIEITESMLIGNEDEAERLFTRLRSMGITLALDDFGTGYSSLHQMAKRPVDFVKLDKSLVDTFMVPGKEDFIGNVSQLIHGLNKQIVVEGVETREQYEMCVGFGCEYIQGFFFARPLPADEAIEFDPRSVVAEPKGENGDKTRNSDWRKYERDKRGRWKKSS